MNIPIINLCKFLKWDSAHFKKRIALINKNTELSIDEMSQIDHWCFENKINCLYYLKNNELNNNFEMKNGFTYLATRIELKKRLESILNNDINENNKILFDKIERESLNKISPEIFLRFNKTRFYRDTNFNRNLVTEMYRIWVKNHMNADNAKVIGAYMDDQIIGLITYELSSNNIPRIGLFSVKRNSGNLGVGSQLLNKCVMDLMQKGKNSLSVVTQKSNSNALKFYLKNGFEIESTYNWFHKWYF